MLMGAKYGHRWSSMFPTEQSQKLAQAEWARELSDMSMDQIKIGLDKSVREYPDWPPTIGQFRKLCEPSPEDHGLPTAADAWTQICREGGEYSHGIVLAARNDPQCDAYNWRLLPMDKGMRQFEPIYRRYVDRALAGEKFELPVMVEDKRDRPVTRAEQREHARKYLAEAMAALR